MTRLLTVLMIMAGLSVPAAAQDAAATEGAAAS